MIFPISRAAMAAFIIFIVLAGASTIASAQSNLQDPWLAPPRRLEPDAYFTNLQNGDKVTSPFVAKFGMTYWGIAPAKQVHPRTGHHHLLVDRPLPEQLGKAIPFDDGHRHFGKGQMEAVLDLPLGKHTLRILLADSQHIPQFIYSKQVEVTVTARDPKGIPADYGKVPRLELLLPASGTKLRAPFSAWFHASGLNIAPEALQLKDTGYFRLAILRPGGSTPLKTLDFKNAQTEAHIAPPAGSYELELQFVANDTGKPIDVKAKRVSVTVLP
jgi:Domain of unknown function (DUF4399)